MAHPGKGSGVSEAAPGERDVHCSGAQERCQGCERCGGSGYRGRVGVFECLEVTGATRELIGPDIDAHALDALAIREGMSTMMDDAVAKCRAGITSVREVLRVTTVR